MTKPRNRYNTKPKPKNNELLDRLILEADQEAERGLAKEERKIMKTLTGEKMEEKKTERQISNRLSALKCRKRGLLYVTYLESEFGSIESNCAQLKDELSKAKEKETELSEKIEQLLSKAKEKETGLSENIEQISNSQWMANAQSIPERDWQAICEILNEMSNNDCSSSFKKGPNQAMFLTAENFEHINTLLNLHEARKKLQERLKSSRETENQRAKEA